jgi:hypothetical protein
MGSIFEDLVRRFNEENNEEAGEHWTPKDVVSLMANLVFLPIADHIESGTYLLYDGACGTGGMLTVAEDTLALLAEEHDKQVSMHLYGQEINAETSRGAIMVNRPASRKACTTSGAMRACSSAQVRLASIVPRRSRAAPTSSELLATMASNRCGVARPANCSPGRKF